MSSFFLFFPIFRSRSRVVNAEVAIPQLVKKKHPGTAPVTIVFKSCRGQRVFRKIVSQAQAAHYGLCSRPCRVERACALIRSRGSSLPAPGACSHVAIKLPGKAHRRRTGVQILSIYRKIQGGPRKSPSEGTVYVELADLQGKKASVVNICQST